MYPGIKNTCIALVAAAALLPSASGLFAQNNYAVTEEIYAVKGTSTVISDSGSSANVSSTWAPSNSHVATFKLTEAVSGTDLYMKVDVTGFTGALTTATAGLGIFRTEDSQGLTDQGSFSIYVAPQGVPKEAWTLNLRFSFFSDAALTEEADTQLLLTTLDLDWNQRYFTSNTTFESHVQGADVKSTGAGIAPTDYSGFTASGDSAFDDGEHAVSSLMRPGLSYFDIVLGHSDVALFMFELRDPPNIVPIPVPVPEPGLMAMAAVGGAALLIYRRRKA